MQKKWWKLVLPVAACLALIACGGEEQTNEADHANEPDIHTPHGEQDALVEGDESVHLHEGNHDKGAPLPAEVVSQLTTQYLAVKDALVAGDAEKVSSTANALSLESDGNQALEHLLLHWKAMASSTAIDAQRIAFEDVSEHMYLIAKANPGENTLYKQYCPMAFDNTGAYWLAAEEEVLNPYFGDAMLRCGTVQETIGG